MFNYLTKDNLELNLIVSDIYNNIGKIVSIADNHNIEVIFFNGEDILKTGLYCLNESCDKNNKLIILQKFSEIKVFCLPTKDNDPTLLTYLKNNSSFLIDYEISKSKDFQGKHVYATSKYYDLDEYIGYYITEDEQIVSAKEVVEKKLDEKQTIYQIIASSDKSLKLPNISRNSLSTYSRKPFSNGVLIFDNIQNSFSIKPTVEDRLENNIINSEDALEELIELGYAPNLLNDDNGHWAVTSEGFQNVPSSKNSDDIVTSIFVKKDYWKKTIKEALLYYLKN